jgi:hypothetical protein
MADPLQALLAAGAVPTTTFPPTSRYASTAVEAWDPGDGSPPVPYLARRFCPQPESLAAIQTLRIAQGDRRDLLAWRALGDAALWWRLADANGVIDPRELTLPIGRTLTVALAAGVPGAGGG